MNKFIISVALYGELGCNVLCFFDLPASNSTPAPKPLVIHSNRLNRLKTRVNEAPHKDRLQRGMVAC